MLAWTAREMAALRGAYRMTKNVTADKLGVTNRSIANWEKEARLAPASEAMLDELLRQADNEQLARFLALLLSEYPADEHSRRCPWHRIPEHRLNGLAPAHDTDALGHHPGTKPSSPIG